MRFAPIILDCTDRNLPFFDDVFRFKVRFADPLYLGREIIEGRDCRVFEPDTSTLDILLAGLTISRAMHGGAKPLFVSGSADPRFLIQVFRRLILSDATSNREHSVLVANFETPVERSNIYVGDMQIFHAVPKGIDDANWVSLPNSSAFMVNAIHNGATVCFGLDWLNNKLPGELVELRNTARKPIHAGKFLDSVVGVLCDEAASGGIGVVVL